jgi:hypothetical protein
MLALAGLAMKRSAMVIALVALTGCSAIWGVTDPVLETDAGPGDATAEAAPSSGEASIGDAADGGTTVDASVAEASDAANDASDATTDGSSTDGSRRRPPSRTCTSPAASTRRP